jgi:hypothetical protein
MKLKKVKSNIIILIILCIGTILRILHSDILTQDEGAFFTEAAKIAVGLKPIEFTANWAPNFISTRHGYFLTGIRALFYLISPSVSIQRAITVFFGVLSILLTYLLAYELYDKKVAILSALLVSIFPLHVILSRGLYSEIPISFFILCTFLFLVKGMKRKNLKLILLSSIFYSFAVLTKVTALLFFFPIILWILIQRRKMNKKFMIIVISFFILSAITWLTWSIPNFNRIYDPSISWSLFNFVFKKNIESVKINLTYEYLWAFSYSVPLILLSIIFAIWKREYGDLLLVFSIIVFFTFFQFISNTNSIYFHIPIVSLYFILVSRIIVYSINFFKTKLFFISISLIMILVFFIFLCVKTNYLALKFNQGGNYGFNIEYTPILPPNYKWTLGYYPLGVTEQGMYEAFMHLKELISKHDIVYMQGNLIAYEGLLIEKNITVKNLPWYKYNCNVSTVEMCYDKNWEENVKKMVRDSSSTRQVWIIINDYAMGVLKLSNIHFFDSINHSAILDKDFKKVYSSCFPDEKMKKKYWGDTDPSKLGWDMWNCMRIYKV